MIDKLGKFLKWLIVAFRILDFIFPTKEMADVIMPRGAEHNAASLIVDGIVSHLTQKPLDKLYAGGASLRPTSSNVFGGEVLDNQKATFYDLT